MVIYRTFLFYFALIAVIRLLGKRQGGQLEPSEFVVTMLIANLASVPLEDWSIPVWGGLVPMGIVFLCERTLSWLCLKSIRLRRLLCGKPVILIENGRLLRENLHLLGWDEEMLRKKLHGKGLTADRVLLMTLTASGECAVFPRE